MVRRRRSSLLASGARDLQERALQEHGDLAHLARQLAAEKAIVGPISVGGSSRTINQWPGVGCLLHVPFWGFWKKNPSPKCCIISMFWFTCLKFGKNEFATSKSPSTHCTSHLLGRFRIFRGFAALVAHFRQIQERLLENLQFSRSCLQAPLRPVKQGGDRIFDKKSFW